MEGIIAIRRVVHILAVHINREQRLRGRRGEMIKIIAHIAQKERGCEKVDWVRPGSWVGGARSANEGRI